MDGDPKAETHFLVLATETFGNIMDNGFTADHLNNFFEVAYKLCQQLGILGQHVRLVANTGTGFQQSPRVHMHVSSARAGLPSMFPVDYGFSVAENGTVVAPANSSGHQTILELIIQRGKVQGFSPEAKAEKLRIDEQLMYQLARLRTAQ
jgi:diadenosine tetraphosphate (Ap4A) HIT family hydrolase